MTPSGMELGVALDDAEGIIEFYLYQTLLPFGLESGL